MRLPTFLPIAALLLSGLSLSGTALAASTSTPVPVNGTVNNSCVFNAGPYTINILNYKATDAAPVAATTNIDVLCNKGTQPFVTYWASEANLDLALKASNNDILNVKLGYGVDPTTPTTGTGGGDLWTYIVTATPVAGQFGASTSTTYTNTADYIVAF